MLRKLLMGAALLLAAGITPLGPERPAHATTLSELSVDQMTDASDLIVRGVITEVWSEVDEQGRIWTRSQIEVTRVLKGASETSAVIVDTLGGVHNEDRMLLPLAPRFSVGEEGLFFLEQLGSGRTSVVGLFQGKYTMRVEPGTGAEMAVRFTVPQDRQYDHRFIPHPDVSSRVYMAPLEEQVQARVAQGWDGQPIPGADPDRLRRINTLQPGVK